MRNSGREINFQENGEQMKSFGHNPPKKYPFYNHIYKKFEKSSQDVRKPIAVPARR